MRLRAFVAAWLFCCLFVVAACSRKEWTREYALVHSTAKQFVLKTLSQDTPTNQSFWNLKELVVFGNDGVVLTFAGAMEVQAPDEKRNQYSVDFPVWCRGTGPSGHILKRRMVVRLDFDRPDHIASHSVVQDESLSLSTQIGVFVPTMLVLTLVLGPAMFLLGHGEYNRLVLLSIGTIVFALTAFIGWYIAWWCFGSNWWGYVVGALYGTFMGFGAANTNEI
jgi:hypothetical protein